jgi:hypothetical protein
MEFESFNAKVQDSNSTSIHTTSKYKVLPPFQNIIYTLLHPAQLSTHGIPTTYINYIQT